MQTELSKKLPVKVVLHRPAQTERGLNGLRCLSHSQHSMPHLQYNLSHVIKLYCWRHKQKSWYHKLYFKIPITIQFLLKTELHNCRSINEWITKLSRIPFLVKTNILYIIFIFATFCVTVNILSKTSFSKFNLRHCRHPPTNTSHCLL